MPHLLVKENDGTWTFKQNVWNSRIAGSLDSNPNPSFIGFPLKDIFSYANRLGFVADTNVILSEANTYENFYRTTLATLVDSDPIDVAVLNGSVDTLFHANAYDNILLLQSDRNQYRLSYQNYLGPKNLQIQFSTSFTMSKDIHPINMGSSIYFVDDKEEYSFAKLFEYFPKGNFMGDDADESTGPVPEYIKEGIISMTGSTRLKTIALVSDNEPTNISLYKFYFNGQQKIQNAWNKWQLPGVTKVYWVGFSFNYLYAIVRREDNILLERFYIDEMVSRDNPVTRYLIDRQLSETDITVTYDAVNEESTITLPFAYTDDVIEVISNGPDYQDARHTVTKVNDTTVKVSDYDLTEATLIRVGIPYTFIYKFPTCILRQADRQGTVAILDGVRLQMRYLTVQTNDTPYFSSRVTYPGRDDLVTSWESEVMDDAISMISGPIGANRTIKIPLMGNNRQLGIQLENDSPWNSQFTSAEWSFFFQTHFGRRI